MLPSEETGARYPVYKIRRMDAPPAAREIRDLDQEQRRARVQVLEVRVRELQTECSAWKRQREEVERAIDDTEASLAAAVAELRRLAEDAGREAVDAPVLGSAAR